MRKTIIALLFLFAQPRFALASVEILGGRAGTLACQGEAPVICKVAFGRPLDAQNIRCPQEKRATVAAQFAAFNASTRQGKALLRLLTSAMKHDLLTNLQVENETCTVDISAVDLLYVELFTHQLL